MQSPKNKKSQQRKHHTLASLHRSIEEYKRQRSYQESAILRLERSVHEKYERVAKTKRRMQYFASWHDSTTHLLSFYPLSLTGCYKVSTASSTFELLQIERLNEEHIIHSFVTKLRESEIACTVVYNFQSFAEKYQLIQPLIINAFIHSLYPSHSQLFDNVVQPLLIELIESQQSEQQIFGLFDCRHFGKNEFVLKLLFNLIHFRINNVCFGPLQAIITRIARGDFLFNLRLSDLCSACIDAIYECDYSAFLHVFGTIFDCLHFCKLELPRADCLKILNFIILNWIIFPILSNPHSFGFRSALLTKWQQTSSAVFVGVLAKIFNFSCHDAGDDEEEEGEGEYKLSNEQMQKLQDKIEQNVNLFEQKLSNFIKLSHSQLRNAVDPLENLSFLSSVELFALHSILFSDSSNLSSSQIRSLEKFHNLRFDSVSSPISNEIDSDLNARSLTEKVLNGQYVNAHLFVVGSYPTLKSKETLIESSALEHLHKICDKNIFYLSKLQIHIQRAPKLFALWIRVLLKVLFSANSPLPQCTMINIQKSEHLDNGNYGEFTELMQYLEQREVTSPSLLFGLSSKNCAKTAQIGNIHFGLQQLQRCDYHPLFSGYHFV